MLNGTVTGLNAGIARNASIRKERQTRLKNYVEGFELNHSTGEYEPNMRGMKALAIQEEELNQKLMAATLQSNLIADKMSAEDMTRATSYLLAGRATDANKVLGVNPILQDRLKKQFGVQTILPLDIDNDIDEIEQANGIQIDRSKLQNPEVRAALQSGYFKTVGTDGKVHIVPTETLVKHTGYHQYVDKPTQDTATTRLKRIREILSGVVKTDEDLAVEHSANNATIAKNNYTTNIMPHKEGQDIATYDANTDVVNAQHQEMVDWFEKNPDKTYSDYQLYLANKRPKAPVDPIKAQKAQAELEKSKVGLEKAKIEKQKAEIDLQKKKAALDAYKQEVVDKRKEKKNKNTVVTDNEFEFVNTLDKAKLTPKTYDQAKRIEAKNIKLGIKPTTEELKTAANMPKYANRFGKLATEIDSVDRNAWKKVTSDIEKITGVLSGPFSSVEEKKKALRETMAKWKLDTKIGSAMADYIKFMSGAAVSDEEFKRYSSIIQNGNWSTKEAAKTTLESFAEALREKAIDNLEGIRFKAPYSYLTYKRQLQPGRRKRSYKRAKSVSKPAPVKQTTQAPNKQSSLPPLDSFKRN